MSIFKDFQGLGNQKKNFNHVQGPATAVNICGVNIWTNSHPAWSEKGTSRQRETGSRPQEHRSYQFVKLCHLFLQVLTTNN